MGPSSARAAAVKAKKLMPIAAKARLIATVRRLGRGTLAAALLIWAYTSAVAPMAVSRVRVGTRDMVTLLLKNAVSIYENRVRLIMTIKAGLYAHSSQ